MMCTSAARPVALPIRCTSATKRSASNGSSALSSAPEVDIFSRKQIGYLLQYFSVGLIHGGLPATQYGFFVAYLNVPGYVFAPKTKPKASRPPSQRQASPRMLDVQAQEPRRLPPKKRGRPAGKRPAAAVSCGSHGRA